MTKQNKPIEEDEIDLIALAKTVWEGRRRIIKTILIFMCIGLFIAIFSENEYTASTTFVPQTSDSKIGGNLGGLAAIAGINLGSMGKGSQISPVLYQQILSSIPFQKELLDTPLTIEGKKNEISFKEYYTCLYSPGVLGYLKKYTLGLPALIISAIKGKPDDVIENKIEGFQFQSISEEEHRLIKRLNEQVVLNVNDKDGYVTITVNMPNAIASAEMTQKTQELLQQYIIDFKVQKSTEQLEFIEKRYNEKGKEFRAIQQKLARFRDRNQNTNSALAQTKLEGIRAEYDLTYGVFDELSKQFEAQQIQVKEDTPVFTVLKPVSIPFERSKPKRGTILIIWTFLGGVIGIGMIFGNRFLKTVKNNWNE